MSEIVLPGRTMRHGASAPAVWLTRRLLNQKSWPSCRAPQYHGRGTLAEPNHLENALNGSHILPAFQTPNLDPPLPYQSHTPNQTRPNAVCDAPLEHRVYNIGIVHAASKLMIVKALQVEVV